MRGTLLFFKVIRQISRYNGTKKSPIFNPNWFEVVNGFEMMHKTWSSTEKVPYCFLGHPSNFKVTQADKSTIWILFYLRILGQSQLSNPSDVPW